MKKTPLLLLAFGMTISLASCDGGNKILKSINLSDYTDIAFLNEEYNYDGKVTAYFNDDTKQDVTTLCSFSVLDTSKLGKQDLTVEYQYNLSTYSRQVAINVITIDEIELTNYDTEWVKGVPFENSGVVWAHLSNDSMIDVTNDCEFSTVDTSTVGVKDLTVTYEGHGVTETTTVQISIVDGSGTIVNVNGVTVNPTNKSVKVGENFTINATVSPSNATNKSVTWKSDKPAIASVSSTGVVTALSKGTATITATTVDGQKTATCTVTVTEEEQQDETITPEQAYRIIEGLEMNVVSDKEYYVRGVLAGVELDQNGFNGYFLNSNLKFKSVKGNGLASSVDDINGKEVVIFGYLENYNGTYQIPYLPADASPTGQKYNAKLTYVEAGTVTEDIEVTNISVSPVNKSMKVGESSTLTATILPSNATNKTVVWNSTNSSVCSVDSTGKLTAKTAGSATIHATSSNGLTATCNVTVSKAEDTPVDGDKYEIVFNQFETDGQTSLNESTIFDQVYSGSSYISSFTNISKVYKGTSGLKMGSSTTGGKFTMNLASSFSKLECREIILDVAQYGAKTTTITIAENGTTLVSGSSGSDTISVKLSTPREITSLTISSTSRAYISGITLVCGELVPIPVTAISIPSTKNISTGNTETLDVTYTPSNANTGKQITWSTNNAGVATVNNGVVTGVSAGNATITATSEGGLKSTCTVTVANVSVASVSLSSTSETLSIGKTKQLTATVSPSNATNKNVTWTSSNTSVASVDNTGLVTANAVGSATITVKTADGNKQATCSITVQEQAADAWTILIYMCGADLESESGLATSDIKEILSVKNQPDNVNIVIETGGAKSWSLGSSYIEGATKIDSSKLSRWHVSNKKIVLDETLTYASMGSSSTLQSFVEYGINEYPAEKTGVIFWNHGGAMYGCCYDEKKNDDSLLNSEMKTAFSKALNNTGSSKLEFVGYDTCLTQVQDIAEFNSNYFNYMIASEESEAGYGWDYDTWVDDLYANKPTETILKAIVDGFITDNGGASSTRSDQTLSYLDLSQMAAYKSAFESFASALKSKLSSASVSKSTFATWMDKNVKAFAVDEDSSETYFCLFDVKDMLNKISANSSYNPGSSYITAVNDAFAKLVKYSVAQKGAGNAYGLGCIYSQGSRDAYYIRQVYTATETNFSNWLSFLKSYSYLG